MNNYVHGYSERETERLYDQANSVRELLHHDTEYPAGCRVLEAGCGVGAQTITLAKNSPNAQFVSVDICLESLEKARALAESNGLPNVQFQLADIFALPFEGIRDLYKVAEDEHGTFCYTFFKAVGVK